MKKILVFACLVLSGCASIIHTPTQDVSVITKPAGYYARIGSQQCKTPCILRDVSRRSNNIIIGREGKEMSIELDKTFNFWAIIPGNIVDGIFPGLIFDVITGSNKTIKPVNLELES